MKPRRRRAKLKKIKRKNAITLSYPAEAPVLTTANVNKSNMAVALLIVCVGTALQLWAIIETPYHPVTMPESPALAEAIVELAKVSEAMAAPSWPYPSSAFDDQVQKDAASLAEWYLSSSFPIFAGNTKKIERFRNIGYQSGFKPGDKYHYDSDSKLVVTLNHNNNSLVTSCQISMPNDAIVQSPADYGRVFYDKIRSNCTAGFPSLPLQDNIFRNLTLLEARTVDQHHKNATQDTENLSSAIAALLDLAHLNSGEVLAQQLTAPLALDFVDLCAPFSSAQDFRTSVLPTISGASDSMICGALV